MRTHQNNNRNRPERRNNEPAYQDNDNRYREDLDYNGDVGYRYGDRNNQENWDDFASDRDRFIVNSDERNRDSRRQGYERGNENGMYGRGSEPLHRYNRMDTGREPYRGGSSSHSGTFYHIDDEARRARAYVNNWNGSSNHPGNNAQRGNNPGNRDYDRPYQEHTSNRNNRFSGVSSRKNR
jgi:hypothetical protein